MTLSESLAGLPAFLLYFALSFALLAVFLVVYLAVTPYSELTLIRQGNAAAAMLCLDGGQLRLFAATRSPQSAASCASTGESAATLASSANMARSNTGRAAFGSCSAIKVCPY